MKVVLKIFLFILTMIFSIILLADITIYHTRDITTKFISEEQIKKSIDNINILDLLKDENGNELEEITKVKQELVNAGLPVEIVEQFIESEPVKNFTSEVISETVDYIFYEKEPEILSTFNEEKIFIFLETNMELIVTELQQHNIPKSELLTKEKQQEILVNLKEQMPVIKENIDKITSSIEESIKSTDEYQDVMDYKNKLEQTLSIIRFVYSDTVTNILIGIGILCIIFIILCSASLYRYLKTLGIISLISGALFYVISFGIDYLKTYINEIPYIFHNLFNLFINDSKQLYLNNAITYSIIGVVLILLNIIIWYILEKVEDKKIDL